MKFSGRNIARFCALLGVLLLTTAAARAEEFYLKDGSRFVGIIVGFDQGSFTIRTNFGTAVIEREQIARVIFHRPRPIRPGDPLVRREFRFPLPWDRRGLDLAPPKMDLSLLRRGTRPVQLAVNLKMTPKLIPPRPDIIREIVQSTRYINQTFRFTLYKPPTWSSYPSLVRPETDMIAALGTEDESTLLLIGWEYFEGDNRTYAALAERSLREIYDDYQLLSQGETRIAGRPVYQRRFSGGAGGRYWTGWTVYLARGSEHYTFLGLTSSEDFSQMQEVVLRRVLNSLQFYRPAPPTKKTETAKRR